MWSNLWKCAEGEEPLCSVFFSSFCLFFCGSVPDPPASWSSLARFTGDESRREINSLVFSALKQQCLWGSLECKAIQMTMVHHQSGLHCSTWLKPREEQQNVIRNVFKEMLQGKKNTSKLQISEVQNKQTKKSHVILPRDSWVFTLRHHPLGCNIGAPCWPLDQISFSDLPFLYIFTSPLNENVIASLTHLVTQAQQQFLGWRACSQWAWIWLQSWVH